MCCSVFFARLVPISITLTLLLPVPLALVARFLSPGPLCARPVYLALSNRCLAFLSARCVLADNSKPNTTPPRVCAAIRVSLSPHPELLCVWPARQEKHSHSQARLRYAHFVLYISVYILCLYISSILCHTFCVCPTCSVIHAMLVNTLLVTEQLTVQTVVWATSRMLARLLASTFVFFFVFGCCFAFICVCSLFRACPPGTEQPSTTSGSLCLPCSAGTYSNANHTANCAGCLAGHFQPSTGKTFWSVAHFYSLLLSVLSHHFHPRALKQLALLGRDLPKQSWSLFLSRVPAWLQLC